MGCIVCCKEQRAAISIFFLSNIGLSIHQYLFFWVSFSFEFQAWHPPPPPVMGCSNLSNCQVFDADALELFASMNLSCGVDGTQHNMSAFCYPDREFDPKNPILKMILTSLIFLISLIGNGLLVVLIIRNFSVFSSVNGYLLNLSFADLLITCTCLWPHTISDRHSHYIFWSFLCSTLAVIQGKNTCKTGRKNGVILT